MNENKGFLAGAEKLELVEMARIILSELSKAEQVTTADFGDTQQSFFSGGGAFSDEYAIRKNSSLTYAPENSRAYEQSEFLGGQEDPPRVSRKQFLEQRIERRKSRDETISESAAISPFAVTANINGVSGGTSARQAAERLSEIVCRDTRRYDGAYERY
ncbi:MAG: hypothetical protein EOM14_07270 [Clostridia bacterium]|nr:hypothetical protein [Clostridia bacterium]